MGDRLYFGAYNTANGNELWSYNLTDGYLQRLTDLMPGNGSSFPTNFVAYKDKLYFMATTMVQTASELYAYTPASNTVAMVADIYAGIGQQLPSGADSY